MIINYHGLFFGLGAVVCGGVYYYLLRRFQVKTTLSRALWDLVIVLLVGLIGARLAYTILTPLPSSTWLDYIAFWRVGLISYGGIVFGLVAWLLLVRRRPQRSSWLDAAALSVTLGWAVGRIGNFLAHDAYGKIDLNFGTLFYHRVPIQLYEAIGLVVLFAVGWWLRRLQPQPGWLFWYVLAGYGLLRFLIDFFRDLPAVFVGLNVSQLAGLGLFIYAMIGLSLWQKKKLL